MNTTSLGGAQLFSVINIIVGLCFFSIAIAFAIYRFKRPRRQGRSAGFALCTFYFLVGTSIVVKALDSGIPNELGFTIGVITCIAGVISAIVVWPMLHEILSQPSHEMLEDLNKKLEHSQQLFDSFMRYTPSIQYVKDRQLRFVFVNDAFCKAFGVKKKDVIGRTNQDWMSEETLTELHQGDNIVFETSKRFETMATLQTTDGMRTFLVVKFPIWDEEFLIGTQAFDITEQKAAEYRESMAKQAFQSMVSAVKEYAIFLLDTDGRIQTWNEGAQRLKGYTDKEIIGKPLATFYPGEDAHEKVDKELRIAKEVGKFEEEGWRVRKDGTQFWASINITPIFNDSGKLDGFIKVCRDLTDQRRAENEIAIQRDKAMEASAMKSAFVANISHEIRTPLSGILGMNELLLQTELNDDQREYGSIVQESAQSLLTVLNDVLDLSKIESGRLDMKHVPFNASFVTQDATRLMLAAAKNKGLRLSHHIDAELPDLVIGDPERLRQVLLNLIGNGVKFTQQGEVSVHAQKIEENSETVTVKFLVKDTGIGISEDEHRYLFVPFAQVDASFTRRFGGTGLGLTISKHLVKKMGGQIGFESEKGKGSCFWFVIPFPKTLKQSARVSHRQGRAIGPSEPIEPTVLVVEDNAILQDLATKQLTNLGVRAVIAKDGLEAVESVNGTKFDAILMDCYMPRMDGYQATAEIRKLEEKRHRRTPIIAMTGATLLGDREKALAAGMDDYVAKPVSLRQLKSVLEKWIDLPSSMSNPS